MLHYHGQTPNEGLSRQQWLASLIGDLTLEGLVSQVKTKLKELVLKDHALFILNDTELGKMHIDESHITMLDGQPVRMPLYRYPEQSKSIVSGMIEDMLSKDVIEYSTATYLSPITGK